LAYKTPFSWKQMVSMAVYPLWMVMSLHVRTMFAASSGMVERYRWGDVVVAIQKTTNTWSD